MDQTASSARRPRRAGTDVTGWTALVTGASSGIGEQFARDLAAAGVDLVVTARSAEVLQRLAEQLRAAHPGRTVTVVPADLARPEAAGDVAAAIERAGLTIDLLVNNAGFGTHGPFVQEDRDRLADELQVNCAALVALTSRLLPGMVSRGRGGVLNVASTAAFQPVATMAVYAATKAFVLSFTEALWAETRGSGVRVLALCPGGTATQFFAATGKEFLSRCRQTPAEVVRVALDAFRHGRGPTVVSGTKNRIAATGYRFVPRAIVARVSQLAVRSD